MSKKVEDTMELLSAGATGGVEGLLEEWQDGVYKCARCERMLYSSQEKWRGPCPWPSWRKSFPDAVSATEVWGYNSYTCRVFEVYCGGCDLFLGHKFEDAKEKGDVHPDAQYRH